MNKYILHILKGLGCFHVSNVSMFPRKKLPVTGCMLPQVRFKLMTFGIGVEHASQRAKGQA